MARARHLLLPGYYRERSSSRLIGIGRSSFRFARAGDPQTRLVATLRAGADCKRSTCGDSARDFPARSSGRARPRDDVVRRYVIVNAVKDLSSGAYVYHPESKSLELLREGDLRSHARFLDLEQNLAGDAASMFTCSSIWKRSFCGGGTGDTAWLKSKGGFSEGGRTWRPMRSV